MRFSSHKALKTDTILSSLSSTIVTSNGSIHIHFIQHIDICQYIFEKFISVLFKKAKASCFGFTLATVDNCDTVSHGFIRFQIQVKLCSKTKP